MDRHHDPERINKFVLDIDESIPVPFSNHFQTEDSNSNNFHKSREELRKTDISLDGRQRTRSLSREQLVSNEDDFVSEEQDLGLSRKSKLNERYLKNNVSNVSNEIQLSETSKLNQRYISNKSEVEPKDVEVVFKPKKRNIHSKTSEKKSKLDNKRSISMQELGLATSALNDRYFSGNDLHKTSSLTEGSDSGPEAQNNVISLSTFRNQNNSSVNENISKTNRTNMSSRPLPAEPGNEGQSGSHIKKSHLNKPHLIRPSSRSSSSSISSEISSAERETDFRIESQTNGEELTEFNDKSNEQNSRYQKYGSKLGAPVVNKHSLTSKAYIDRSVSRDSEYQLIRGSAMSDTSESPSLASHVRNIRIPSHTSELDQYLDDLFNPVLDANLDELSDARSLAASIKGGSQSDSQTNSTKTTDNQKIFTEVIENKTSFDFMDDIDIEINEFQDLLEVNKLVTSLKGGGKSGSEVILTLISMICFKF